MPGDVPAEDPVTRREKIKWNGRTTVASIVALAALEWVALYQGIDGAYFMPIAAAVAALGGAKAKDLLQGKH